MNTLTRRSFLQQTSLASALIASGARSATAAADVPPRSFHLATNVYPWFTFYRRDGRDFNASLDAGLGEVASAGLEGFEPIINGPADLETLGPLLKKHGLELRSFYVNSTLHTSEEAQKSIDHILAIGQRARQLGTRLIVTNPNPLRWGGTEAKNDRQLQTQADALNTLGEKLARQGLTLTYHNHDMELREAAREFHHMMLGTDPKHVTLCLDAHWIYRGSGNSAVALFDVVKVSGRRVTELHLRQSVGGVWTEAFGEGDIDYVRLARELASQGVKPHLVLEQAVEADTPKTLTAVEAHRRGVAYARKVFGA